jgi:putative ATP-binding cassette transporter
MNLARLFKFLAQYVLTVRFSRTAIGLVILAGMLSGAATAGLIASINAALNRQGSSTSLSWGFVGLCAAIPITRFFSNFLLVRLTNRALKELRLEMCKRILSAPLRQLEQIGAPRLLAAITEDIGRIVSGIANIPQLTMNLSLVIGSLVYMGILSWKLLLFVLAAIAVGIATYRLPVLYAQRYFRREREAWDHMFRHLRGITEGTKELKIHGGRRREFVADLLEPTAEALRQHNVAGNTTYDAANAWGQVLFFVVIGVVLFVRPTAESDMATLAGYTLTLLYIMNPLQSVLSMLPNVGRASLAVQTIEGLGLSLEQSSTEVPARGAAESPARWREIALAGVEHSYKNERDSETFVLGPLDLTLTPGETIFLVGGNGSGKTTLAKLLLGLYVPERGELCLDGVPVTDQNRDLYRQLFSAVFTDFFLFDRLLGLDGADLGEKGARYLEELHLDRKVQLEGRQLSTLDLSQGQRKRLALLTAYLEDRPIYLFDEWAADQDPYFKNVFYTHLLPDLKARGKTILVISHDDRYYGVADRIVRLEYGKIDSDLPANRFLNNAPPAQAAQVL